MCSNNGKNIRSVVENVHELWGFSIWGNLSAKEINEERKNERTNGSERTSKWRNQTIANGGCFFLYDKKNKQFK